MSKVLFTSESVTEGHPDKICDQISDAILDAILEKDPDARVACETTCSTGLVHIMGEITTDCYVDIPGVARQVIREIGYNRAKYGFDCDTCGVITNIDGQSPDIALGTNDDVAGKTLFIDATSECVKVTNNNKLTPENIERIVDVFAKREETEHFSHLASYEEVSENDYNLSVSNYVEAEDTREKIDIVKLNAEIKEIVAREQVLRDEIDKIIAEIEVG